MFQLIDDSFSGKSLLFFSLCLILFIPVASLAGDCGQDGVWNCSCGDTLVDSVNMSGDMTDCTGHGLVIGADNIRLDCKGYMIDGNESSNSVGINNSAGYDNFTMRNCVIREYEQGLVDGIAGPGGIFIAENGTIENNTFHNITPSSFQNLLVGSGKLYNNNTFFSNFFVLFSNYHSAPQCTNAYVNVTNSTFNSSLYIVESTNVRLTNNKINNNLTVTGNHPSPTEPNIPSYNITVEGNDFAGTGLDIVNVTNSTMQNNHGLSSILLNQSSDISLTNNSVCVGEGTIHMISNSYNNTGDNICNSSKLLDEDNNNVTCYWDCSGQPNCGATLNSDLVLSKDLTCSNTALTLGSDNVSLDCNNHNIVGNFSGGGGESYKAIFTNGTKNVTIKNCFITNYTSEVTGVGVYGENINNSLIENVTTDDNGLGILLMGFNNIVVNSTFENSAGLGVQPPSTGVFVIGSHNLVNDNILNNNTYGILVARGGTSTDKTNNTIDNNVVNSSTYGILISHSSNSSITDNTVYDSDSSGIVIENSSSGNVTNNTVFSNGDYGIYLMSDSNNTNISENVIYNHLNSDIFLKDDSGSNSGNNTCNLVIDNDTNGVNCTEFVFYGYTKYPNGTCISGTNATVEIYSTSIGFQRTESLRGNSDSSGLFGVKGIPKYESNQTMKYKVVIRHYNDTNYIFVDWIGPTLPALPYESIRSVNGLSFHLEPGATLNITALNETSQPHTEGFQYVLKDLILGYPVSVDVANTHPANRLLHVAKDRNYSLWMYTADVNESSFRINSSNIADGYYEGNYTMTFDNQRLSGNISADGVPGWDNISVATFHLEPGNMIRFGGGDILYNISGDDQSNLVTGEYDVSVVAPCESGQYIMALYSAYNSSEGWYGGYKKYNLECGNNLTQKDITLQPMAGTNGNIAVTSVGLNKINKTFPLVNFTIRNSTGSRVKEPVHLEIEVDYEEYNMSTFTILAEIGMKEMAQGVEGYREGLAMIPLLNRTGTKNVNVFVKGTSPYKKDLKVDDLWNNSVDIQLNNLFNMEDPEGGIYTSNLYIDLVKYIPQCNVPYYPSNCSLLGGATTPDDSDIIKTVFGGGRLNFVMKREVGGSNITVMYLNTDLMASGPPDAIFDSEGTDRESSSRFEQAWKFGSTGPEIYDRVIIGIPYKEGSASQTGFDEDYDMRLDIPRLYGEEFSAGPVWDSSEGDNITNISTAGVGDELYEFSDYLGTEYEQYLNSTPVVCNDSDDDLSSSLCYRDKDNNMIWFKIKHFSGIGPTPNGTIRTAATTTTGTTTAPSTPSLESLTTIATTTTPSETTTTTTTVPPDEEEQVVEIVAAGDAAEFEFEESDTINVQYVSIVPKRALANIAIRVRESTRPSNASDPISSEDGKVYKYLELTKSQFTDDDIESANISFKVGKSWVVTNSIDENKVYLYRYYNNSWEKLSTTKLSSDANYIYYSANTTGFSIFAIGGEKVPSSATTTTPVEDSSSAWNLALWHIIAIIIVIAIVILVGLYYYGVIVFE